MARQFSVTLRTNWAGQVESTIGTSPKLQIRTGAPPATCATANSGTLLAELPLPSDWLNAASAGSVTLLGTWQVNAVATGTIGHYRIFDTALATCHEQGTAGTAATDLIVDAATVSSIGQQVTITAYTLTMPGA